MIFEKKYAPRKFEDLVFPDSNTRQRLWEYANNKRHNSIIFHGPYGTAKTTTARMLVELRSAGLEFGGVDFYRASDVSRETFTRISNVRFLQQGCGVEMPVTIIDEVDKVPESIQYQLRWDLDIRSDHGCYIFTTNKLFNVDPGVVDRCDVVELPAANSSDWLERVRWILSQENVEVPEGKLLSLLDTCDGSIRDLMRLLEDIVIRNPRVV